MTSKPDEAGLPVGHAADKSDANEDDGTSHNVPNPEEAAKEARELLLADSATCQAPISHGSLQNNAQEVLLELPASRQSASPVPLEAPKQTEKCIDSTAEEQAAPSDTAAQDDPGAHEPPLPSTISEGEAIDQNDQKQLSPPKTDFPHWLIKHCVTTCEEWKHTPDTLLLKDFDLADDKKQPSTDEAELADRQEDLPAYEMASILFEPLLGLVGSVPPDVDPKGGAKTTVEHHFSTDIIQLQASIKSHPHTTTRFLQCVIRHFAKTVDADLITLSQHDLEDLADHLKKSEKVPEADESLTQSADQSYMSFLFGSSPIVAPPTSSGSETSDSEAEKQRDQNERPDAGTYGESCESSGEISTLADLNEITLPAFSAIPMTPASKRLQFPDVANSENKPPLIIHLIIDHFEFNSSFVQNLRKIITRPAIGLSILVVISTEYSYSGSPYSFFHWSYADVVMKTLIPVVPMRSRFQETTLERDSELELRARNIRAMQRRIRRKVPKDLALPLLEPYDDWMSLDSNLAAATFISKADITDSQLEALEQMVGSNFDESRIRRAFLSIEAREKALQAWDADVLEFPSQPANDDDSSTAGKWADYPLRIRDTIHKINAESPSDGTDRFYWEKKFLDLIVNPKEVEKGWSDIAIDPQTEQEIREVIQHYTNTAEPQASYGVLKRGNIGGALLYGPPGTGKTQLARVLACLPGLVVVCASAADIENRWSGEAEKAIRGLFNLGKLLAPSVIFIDEADSLFPSRESISHHMPWKRDTVNQMLAEMDGLTKSKATPFILLATNHPNDLDSAVLRRFPSHLYLGLPSTALRIKIFDIVLSEELLDSDINSMLLASMTHQYSGSDIRSICVQAAIMCDTWVETEGREKKRLLTRAVFEKALERTRPTATKPAISAIKTFAKEYNPKILQKIRDFEADELVLQGQAAAELRNREKEAETPDNLKPVSTAPETLLPALSTELPPRTPALPLSTSSSLNSERLGAFPLNAPAEQPWNSRLDSHRPSCLYKPLGSKKIRVINIRPLGDGESPDMPVSCSLEEVDMTDWTSSYQSFRNLLPHMGNDFRLINGRIRHVLWEAHNFAIRNKMPFKDIFEPSIQAQMKRNSPLHLFCDKPLEHFADLEDRYNWGDFVALSYVWGDQSRKKTILINGLPFEVGPSLHEALLSLQNSFEVKSRGLKVWIDAICINQEDLKERAREVQKMEMIYSEALVVRAWLGNPSPEVSAELNSVREMLNLAFHTEFNPLTRVNFEDEGVTLQQAKPKTLPDFWELMAKDGNKAYAIWTFIEEISQLSYWRRLWILQEVSLGSSFLFWYGDHYFSSEHIRVLLSESLWGRGRCFSTLSPYVEKERLQATAFSMIRIIQPIGSLRWDSEQPIVDVISRAKVANATDFRDKVYGILAFLPSTITRRIEPDYASDFSWKACWTMFAKSCFEGFGNLDLLARSAGRGWTSLGIPTWAFDFSPSKSRYSRSHLAPGASGFYADDMEDDPPPATHAFESNKGLVATFQFSDDDSRLFCKGAFVDTVGAIATFGSETRGQAAALQNSNHFQSGRLSGSYSRLELARVLKYDSNFKFGDGEEPSILDMPWISPDELFQTEVSPDDFKLDAYLYPKSRRHFGAPWNIRTDKDLRGLPWAECYKQDTVRRAFSKIFHPNEFFELQGIPLKDFFTSIGEYCEDVPNFVEAVGSTYELLRWRRLFQTGNGFIGSITKHALPGDKIAIMYNCDAPVVLRPSKSGDTYEVVGGCFVEGYMKGELVENIKSGKLKTETLCLV